MSKIKVGCKMDCKICETIKKLRIKKKLSQEGLARAIGVSRSKVSSWEIGRRDISITDAIVLAKYFNVSLDFLINGN